MLLVAIFVFVVLNKCAEAQTQSAAKLAFSMECSTLFGMVNVYCSTPTVDNRSQLSEMNFFALDSNYSYTVVRN